MTFDLSTIEGDVAGILTTGKAAIPAIQALLGVLAMVDPALAADVAVVNKVIAFASGLETMAPNLSGNVTAAKSAVTALEADFAAIATAYKAL